MRRLIALLLLTFLPLQFSWAAVESYCGHAAKVEVEHFGHHEHLGHASAPLEADRDGPAQEPASDADCTDCHCHGHCAGILGDAGRVGQLTSIVRPMATLDDAGGAHAPTRPERPQWAPLA